MGQTISDQAALRVALASKQLPNIDLRSLLGLLIQHLGEPLTESKLVGLSPKSFRVMVSALGETTRKEVTNALAILCNPELSRDSEPPQIPELPPMQGAKLRVAVTSNQGEMVNGHYGSCVQVLIYDVNGSTHQLVDVREMPTDSQGEERAVAMVNRIRDCHIMFTLSIGGPAAARVTRANVHPIKKMTPVSAHQVLTELSHVISYNPPPWIKRALGIARPDESELVLEESYE